MEGKNFSATSKQECLYVLFWPMKYEWKLCICLRKMFLRQTRLMFLFSYFRIAEVGRKNSLSLIIWVRLTQSRALPLSPPREDRQSEQNINLSSVSHRDLGGCVGGLQDYHRLNNSPERLTGLRSCHNYGYSLSQRLPPLRIQIKITKGKRHMWQSPSFQVSPPTGVAWGHI